MPEEPSCRMMKLMIVDDRAGSRETIRKLFTSLEVAVRECTCLEEAVRVAREFKPDWITIDVETTRIQSLAVTAVLRAEHPAIRIVTITGDVQPALVSRTEEPEAMIFVRKDNLHQLPALLVSTRVDRGSAASL